MTKVEHLERGVRDLSPEELASFREWFVAVDSAEWDHQIESDMASGRLDRAADLALADHQAGQSRRL